MGCRDICQMQWASSTERPVTSAISSMFGSRPCRWTNSREALRSLVIVSTMCTGTRIVRLWSAIARVIACRIHQVA